MSEALRYNILEALYNLRERNGSTLKSIQDYILANQNIQEQVSEKDVYIILRDGEQYGGYKEIGIKFKLSPELLKTVLNFASKETEKKKENGEREESVKGKGRKKHSESDGSGVPMKRQKRGPTKSVRFQPVRRKRRKKWQPRRRPVSPPPPRRRKQAKRVASVVSQ